MIAAALLVLVVLGVVGVVAMGVWESRLAATAPAQPALLAVLDEAVAARTAATDDAPAVAARPVRALRAALVH